MAIDPFAQIAENLDAKMIDNQQMEVENNINTYKLIPGISNIKGGIKVLEDLEYDSSIVEMARKVLDTINI